MEGFTQRIAIIGIGLIGGSILKDLIHLNHNPDLLYGVEDDPSATYAKQKGMICGVIPYRDLFKKNIAIIIIASPIHTIPSIARTIKKVQNDSSRKQRKKILVIDVASVKSDIAKTFENLSDNSIEFVATHPMAGTEFSGLDHARLNLFRGKPWMITPHARNTPESLALAQQIIHRFGGRIKILDSKTHDTYAAAVSHSTILLSNYIFEFLSNHYPEALELAGSGFDSTTRLASGNPELHASIMGNNAQTIDEVLAKFTTFMNEKGSVTEIPKDYFVKNKEKRDEWLLKKTITFEDRTER